MSAHFEWLPATAFVHKYLPGDDTLIITADALSEDGVAITGTPAQLTELAHKILAAVSPNVGSSPAPAHKIPGGTNGHHQEDAEPNDARSNRPEIGQGTDRPVDAEDVEIREEAGQGDQEGRQVTAPQTGRLAGLGGCTSEPPAPRRI